MKGSMKQFNCGDVVPGCQWVGQNDVDEKLWSDIADHYEKWLRERMN